MTSVPVQDARQQAGVFTAADGAGQASVRIVGTADHAAVTETADAIRGLLTAGVRHLTVDVSQAHDVDRRLLTVLARTRAHLNTSATTGADPDSTAESPRGPAGSLSVTGVVLPHFLAALAHATLDEVFVIHDAVRPATSSGRPRGAASAGDCA